MRTLTANQFEALQLAARGLTYKQIGRRLGISTVSVGSRIFDACRNLEAANVTHAVALAVQRGLIRVED